VHLWLHPVSLRREDVGEHGRTLGEHSFSACLGNVVDGERAPRAHDLRGCIGCEHQCSGFAARHLGPGGSGGMLELVEDTAGGDPF
jgi:hypothetical protein